MTTTTGGHGRQQFNPMIEPHRQNPHLFYDWSRAEQPLVYSEALNAWTVSRYEDMMEVIRDPETYSSAPSLPSVWNTNTPEVLALLEGCVPEARTMINVDPPDHRPMRMAFSLAFTPARVKALLPEMHAKANALIEGFIGNGKADLVSEYASPYVRHVISLAIGIPKADIEMVHQWNEDWAKIFNPLLPGPEKLEAAKTYREYEEYVRGLLYAAEGNPSDTLLSDLVNGADGIEPVPHEDALYLIRGSNMAGWDTTRDTIGSSVLMLMEHRDLWDASRGVSQLISRVVEETLRKEAPHRGLMRMTTRDVVLGGQELPAGTVLLLLFGSGNRDEQKFAEPGSFDVDRPNVREHLAFGRGIHTCPGAPLARQEIVVALEILRERLPELRLAEGYEPTYEASYFFRSPEHVLVEW